MISARTSPRAKTRTTELWETTTATAPGRPRDRGGGGVTGTQARQEVLRGAHVDVDEPPCRDEGAVVGEQERAVELRQLLHRLAELGPLDPKQLVRVAEERVEDQGRDCSVTTSTSPITNSVPIFRPSRPSARELDGEVDDLLERAPPLLGALRRLADHAEGCVQHLLPTVQVHPSVRTIRRRGRFRGVPLPAIQHVDLCVSDVGTLAVLPEVLGPEGSRRTSTSGAIAAPRRSSTSASASRTSACARPTAVATSTTTSASSTSPSRSSPRQVDEAHERCVGPRRRVHFPARGRRDLEDYYAFFVFDPDGLRIEVFWAPPPARAAAGREGALARDGRPGRRTGSPA